MARALLEGLQARIRALEDAAEIRNVIASYSLAAGQCDEKRWVGQFADDGAVELEGVTHVGKEALKEFFYQRVSVGKVSHQEVHNVRILVDGDNATGEAYWTALKSDKDGNSYSRVGYYHDEYVRTSLGWKIKRRLIQPS